MIETRLMATGGWDLTLRSDTPQSVLDLVDDAAFFGHIIVTPTWVDPNAVTESQLRELARYVGVYRARADGGRSMSGPGLAMWLGDEDDKGDLKVTTSGSATATFTAFWEFWESSGMLNGLTLGDVEAIGGTWKVKAPPLVTGRTLIEKLSRQVDGEWRINPDGTIDAGTATYLFVDTPTVVLTREGGARDLNVRGLPVTTWGDQIDAEDYATGVLVPYADDTNYAADRDDTPPYKRLDGEDMILERVVEAPNISSATQAENLAEKERAKTNDVRIEIAPSVDVYDIGEFVEPGDAIYAYDPSVNVVNLSTETIHRGQTIFPMSKRVYATVQPIRQGMGKYLRLPDASGTVVDLTRWVAAEDGDCTLEVGAARRAFLTHERRGAA